MICIVMDVCFGRVFKFLHSNAIGGSTRNNSYILYECKSDVIILGSSRASHHYIPRLISEETGLSCYNCGEDGNGIILASARYQMLVQRYHPKIIIYDLVPEFDLRYDADNSKYLHYIKPFYSEAPIKKVVDQFTDWKTQFELVSNMYRNNATIIANIIDCIIDRGKHDGYVPLYGQISNNSAIDSPKDAVFEVDNDKYELLDEMVDDAIKKQIKIVFVISPTLVTGDMSRYNLVQELAANNSIPFIDYSNCPEIVENRELFQDEDHLNKDGATIYSHLISTVINKYK